MTDGREELLKRLTSAGWLLIAVNMALLTLLVPLALHHVFPPILKIGGRATGIAVMGTFTLCLGVGFFAGKWLLEKAGVTVLRPAPPSPCSTRPQDSSSS